MKNQLTKPDIDLAKIFNNDLDLMLFYFTWIKNGMNAGKAYKELHPNTSMASCYELGSRTLKKVDKEEIMRAYGLDQEIYFQQLKDALGATKWNDFTGEREPDHKTRAAYHDKLGKLLGFESERAGFAQQINTQSEKLLVVRYSNPDGSTWVPGSSQKEEGWELSKGQPEDEIQTEPVKIEKSIDPAKLTDDEIESATIGH